MHRPTISVLLTYHNEGSLLTATLDSLRAGDDQPDEVLVYDDASDLRPEAFIPVASNARVIRGDRNIGPGAGRNILLKEAASDYIHFHDSDDWFNPDWCAVVRAKLARNPVDVLFTEVTSSSACTPEFKDPFMGFDRFDRSTDLVAYAIQHALLVPSGTIKRESALHIGGFRKGLWQSEDKDFYIRLAASGVSWEVEIRPLICIRHRPNSRGKGKHVVEVWQDGLKCLEFARDELPSRYHHDIANAAARLATQLFLIDQKASARRALRLVKKSGGADYSWRNPKFRRLLRLLGAESAEWVSSKWLRIRRMFEPTVALVKRV